MRLFFIADIFGKAGKNAVHKLLPVVREQYEPDVVIANGENIAGGFGITPNLANKLFHYGIDIITLGNHAYDRNEIEPYLDENDRILRPANYPDGNTGRGHMIYELEDGRKLGIGVFAGRIFMNNIDCPFRLGETIIKEMQKETRTIFIDMHAETTSEKRAFANHFNGYVSAVCGTHTHVQTADEQILSKGTAFITDAGMTGPHDSVIGVKSNIVIAHMLLGKKVYFSPSNEGVKLQGVIIDIMDQTGKALKIERISMDLADADDSDNE